MFIDNMRIICISSIMHIHVKCFPRFVVISCTQWWEVEGCMRGMPPSITAKYIKGTLAGSAITPFSQYSLTNLLGFCLNITHIALKASIFRNCPQTEVTLMCTEHFLMIRYKPTVMLCPLPSPDITCALQPLYHLLHCPPKRITRTMYHLFSISLHSSWPSGQHIRSWLC